MPTLAILPSLLSKLIIASVLSISSLWSAAIHSESAFLCSSPINNSVNLTVAFASFKFGIEILGAGVEIGWFLIISTY